MGPGCTVSLRSALAKGLLAWGLTFTLPNIRLSHTGMGNKKGVPFMYNSEIQKL
jgi:hypothetical protein